MTQQQPIAQGDASDEITALVAHLRDTEQRLQALTGGGVDAVLYAGGQAYLLQEAQEKLRSSEEHFRGIFDASATGIAISTPDGRFLRANAAYCRMLGYTEDELQRLNFASVTHPDDLPLNVKLRDEVLAGRRPSFVMEKRYLRKNGDILWTRHSVSATRAADGEVTTFIVVAEDVTEHKLAELRLRRLNRLHTVLSKVGEAIVRIRDRQELYEAVCRILVDDGQLRMAFLAEVDAEAKLSRPVAGCGAGWSHAWGQSATISTEGGNLSLGPVATTLRTGAYDLCNDIGADSRMDQWRKALLDNGLLAIASFPIALNGSTGGVLSLYAGERDYFLDDEVALMIAVANNLSYALEALEQERRRRRAETLSKQLAAIVEASEDAIIGKDLNGIVTSWNKGAEKTFGYAAEDMVGMSIMRLIPPGREDEEDRILERVRSGESVRNFETLRRSKDGRLINVSVTTSPIRNSAGKVIGASKVARDITQAKKSEARFRRLVDSNAECIFFWNIGGEITGANDAFLRLVSYTRADLDAGRISWSGMTPPEYGHLDERALAEIAARGVCATYEKEFIRKDGSRAPILIGAATFEDNPSEGVCFVVDLTERKRLEQQLRQSQKMDSLGQLTGGIAHDFNNLLGIVQLNLELIRERLSDDPEGDEMVGMALAATERGTSLTSRLLAFARQQPLDPKPVKVLPLLSGLTILLERTLSENIEIRTTIPADLWTVNTDPHQLESALLNLALNAQHAMPDGGRLIIEASNCELGQTYAEVNPGALPGRYVMFSITDTGTGMTPEVLERSLEPFFTTKPVGKGTGLGLSMVHGFVKQSGGNIRIESEVGRGTTVKLYLPRSVEAEPEIKLPPWEAPPAGGREVVLVVEDDPAMRDLTLRVLASLGYRTIEAEDGPAGCELLESIDRIDLLLTDVVLPKGMNGPGLARQARSRRPGLKVLYMSGYSRDVISRDGEFDGDVPLLSKPFPRAELARMVRKVLDEGVET